MDEVLRYSVIFSLGDVKTVEKSDIIVFSWIGLSLKSKITPFLRVGNLTVRLRIVGL